MLASGSFLTGWVVFQKTRSLASVADLDSQLRELPLEVGQTDSGLGFARELPQLAVVLPCSDPECERRFSFLLHLVGRCWSHLHLLEEVELAQVD